MKRKSKVFISYKTGLDDGLTFAANNIKRYIEEIEEPQYEVWMDTSSLQAGKDWNAQIYEQIPRSDVVVLLLAETTADSDWVQREIDVARGAMVSVLPVLIRGNFDTQKALDKLDLSRTQYVEMLSGTEKEIEYFAEQLKNIRNETRRKQREWLDDVMEGGRGTPHNPPVKEVATYQFVLENGNTHPSKIHISAGNMIKMTGIDVYVNTENDYMQMARIIDSRTISSLLRYHGSYINKADRLVEDTVQDELNAIIQADPDLKTRPVGVTTVIATSAGHKEGQLRKTNHARYIFHAATVSVEGDGTKKWLEPIAVDSGLRRCVVRSLEKVLEVDNPQVKGVISPNGTEQRKWQQALAKTDPPEWHIKSIMFPLFGTGHGGRPPQEVMRPMVKGIKDFLVQDNGENPDLHLEDIYVCVYYAEDVDLMKQVMQEEFGDPIVVAG